MTTVAALIDRTYRQILEPPDAQPASARLAGDIDETIKVFSLSLFDIPEDENLVRLGSIIEVDSELMRVVDYGAASREVTVLRGYLGSEAVAHLGDAQVKLSPPYPRMDVFSAVTENIVALYPDLWTVRTTVIAPAGDDVYPIADPLTVEVVELNPPDSPVGTVNIPARIVDNHPRVGGRALVVNGSATGQLWLRYRRRFALAADETALLADLGVETVWNTMVMVGAAADMMSGRDVQAVQTEWVQNALQSENIRVGTRLSVAGGLAQYRDILMERFMKEMRGEDSNKIRMHQREVFA